MDRLLYCYCGYKCWWLLFRFDRRRRRRRQSMADFTLVFTLHFYSSSYYCRSEAIIFLCCWLPIPKFGLLPNVTDRGTSANGEQMVNGAIQGANVIDGSLF